MKTKTLLLVAASIALNYSGNLLADDHWDNRAGIFLGSKHLDKDDFQGDDLQGGNFQDNHHGALGFKFDLKRHSWPVSIAIDLMTSGEEKKTPEGKTERVTGGFHLGIRKHWQFGESFESFVGGGLNFSAAERKTYVDGVLVKENDKDIGYWLGTGIAWRFEGGIRLGAEARYSDSEVTLYNEKVNTGGVYTGLYLAYKF